MFTHFELVLRFLIVRTQNHHNNMGDDEVGDVEVVFNNDTDKKKQ